MKYIVAIIIILPSLYTFSYAKSVWKKKDVFPAIGAIFLAVLSIVLPLIMLFIR